MEKEIIVVVSDSKCEGFQSSYTVIEIQGDAPIEEFVKKIDEFIEETKYEKVEVVIDAINFVFTSDEEDFLNDNGIQIFNHY